MMDCICDNIVGNSFIANVNLLASQFGTLQQILAVPDDVEQSLDQIKAIENTIAAIQMEVEKQQKEIDKSVGKAETFVVNASNIKDETSILHVKTMEVLEKCRKALGNIQFEINRFEADKVLAEGISNNESVFTCPKDLCPGFVLTVKGFRYPVGRNTLLVSCDGVEFYRWIHFEEVGPKNSISSMIKINVPVRKGSVLKFYNISSSMSESAFVKAKELKCELDRMHREINKDVENVLKAKDFVRDSVVHINALKKEVKNYVDKYLGCCNGILVLPDYGDIPDEDCLFIVNRLAPIKPVLRPCDCTNKPCITESRNKFAEGSICGTIVNARKDRYEYESGCFDVTYNKGRC